jgi:serine/threonine-protein kinase
VDDGRLYVATRYISGGGLVRMLERRGWLEPDIVPTLLGPVAAALDAAHDAGVVHGSVRPDGILLLWSKDGTLEDVYISEFGMAGHPSDYLAPEQLEGGEATARSDVYSLGCVLYHALTGRVPFARGVDRGFVGAPSVVRDMPNAVDGPVLRALSADPSKRFETCGELMAAYGAAADGSRRAS